MPCSPAVAIRSTGASNAIPHRAGVRRGRAESPRTGRAAPESAAAIFRTARSSIREMGWALSSTAHGKAPPQRFDSRPESLVARAGNETADGAISGGGPPFDWPGEHHPHSGLEPRTTSAAPIGEARNRSSGACYLRFAGRCAENLFWLSLPVAAVIDPRRLRRNATPKERPLDEAHQLVGSRTRTCSPNGRSRRPSIPRQI